MALNLKYLIAARYVRSPKSHSVINIISGVSVVAMAVPVAAIILLLSIFNGLERMTGELYNAVDADLKITPATGTTFMVEAIDTASLRSAEYIKAFSLQLEQSALAEHDGRQSLISVKGVEQSIQDVISVREHLRAGTFNTEFDENDCLVLAHGEYAKNTFSDAGDTLDFSGKFGLCCICHENVSTLSLILDSISKCTNAVVCAERLTSFKCTVCFDESLELLCKSSSSFLTLCN